MPLATRRAKRALLALGLRPSACKPSRPVSGRGQGRQPPKAGARSASLEPGRAPVYSAQLLSPQAVGESHMHLRSLLPWSARWILRTTPAWRRESDGEIQEDFSTVAGPAGRQCAARFGGGIGRCLGGDAVRGGYLLRHGRVRASQGNPVAAVS